MPKMPPEIVRKFLRAAFNFPSTQNVKIIMIENKYSARTISIRSTESAHVDTFRATMDRVWTRITGSSENIFRFNNLYDRRGSRIRFYVNYMDPGRADPRDNKVPSFEMRMRRVGAQCCTARVPSKVMQFIADIRQIDATDHGPERR